MSTTFPDIFSFAIFCILFSYRIKTASHCMCQRITDKKNSAPERAIFIIAVFFFAVKRDGGIGT